LIVLKEINDYDRLDPEFRDKVNSYICFARWYVPYYRRSLQDFCADFSRYYEMPFTKDDSLSSDPLSFVAFQDRVVRATASGGTSGKRKMIFRTEEDLERSVDTVTKVFRGAGVKRGDRIAILQPFDMWNTGHHAMAAFQRIGALSFPLGLSGTDEYVLWLLEKLCCNILFATPSRASFIASLGKGGFCLERVLCTGEPILEAHRESVRNAWGAEIFGTYGTEEFDGIAYECAAHDGYHLVDDDLIVEIVDPETLMPAGGRTGLLVLSKINRTGTVLLRYAVGDIVEVDEKPCRCGSSAPRLKFIRRASESIYLYNGLKISLQPIEGAIRSVLGSVPIYQIILEGGGGKERMRLIIQKSGSDDVRDQVLRSVLSSIPDLEEAYALDKTVDIQVVLDGSFSSFSTTRRGKLPRVVDRRQSPP
jgi:phenylacetate-CoA ligase